MRRPNLRTFHLILAIGAGFLVALTGLTGSILAFRGEIDAALNPSLWRVEPAINSKSPGQVLAAVEATGGPPPRMILFPDRKDRALLVLLVGREPSDRWEVFVDPSTATVLGRRRFGSAWTERVKRLHTELFAGKAGRIVVGAGGLCSLALGGTGLVLWWRSRPRLPKGALPKQTALDLHRQLGIVGLIPSIILATTGALLIFRPYLAPALNLVTGPMPLESVALSRGDRTLTAPTPDQIYDQALLAYPNARVTRLYLPEGEQGSFAVRLHLPDDGNPHGNTAMRFDRYSGELLQQHSSRSTSLTQKILWYAAYPWHTGDAIGLPGRGIVALSGIIPAVLLMTGLICWTSRRRGSSAANSPTSSRPDRRLPRGSHGLLLALTMLGAPSCGTADGDKAVHPVQGQLSFKDRPTPGALIFFHPVDDPDPRAPRPHGRVDRDGHFALTTYRADDGAPAGRYVVTIDWRKEIPGRGGVGPSLLPTKYGLPGESPLRFAVVAGTNEPARFTIP